MSLLDKLKKLHKSKTVLINAAVIVAASAPGVIEAVGPMLGANALAKATAGLAVLNMLLRLVTVKPIEHK